MMLTSCEVEFGKATCARVPHHIYTHPLRRSGLLPFFSPPVIQEWLINFAGERQRSRMTSHCEIILGFCLSASHPVVELGLTGLTSTSRSIRTTCAKSLALLRSSDSVLSVRPRILLFHLIREHVQLCGDCLELFVVVHKELVLHVTCHHFAWEVEAFVPSYLSRNGFNN